MINLKIDGKEVQIAPGATILDAAETVGIKIPTLCYLKKVSPTGACRVCAVEVDALIRGGLMAQRRWHGFAVDSPHPLQQCSGWP